MEEYTNRELGLLLEGIKTDLKDMKNTHHDSIVALKKVIYGNGKKGLIDQINDLKMWKYAVVAIGSILTPVTILVLQEIISRIFS